MKKESRYTQSNFNELYGYPLFLRSCTYYDRKSDLKLIDEINLKLKNDKYLDGSICPELFYIQNIDDKSGHAWLDSGLPEPNIIMRNDNGISTYIYVVILYDIDDFEPILTEEIKSSALFFNVKCDYPEWRSYFDYFQDLLFSYFKKSLNSGSWSKELENPNCSCWNPIFRNVPAYSVKDFFHFINL